MLTRIICLTFKHATTARAVERFEKGDRPDILPVPLNSGNRQPGSTCDKAQDRKDHGREGDTMASNMRSQPMKQPEAPWSWLQPHCGEIGVVSLSTPERGAGWSSSFEGRTRAGRMTNVTSEATSMTMAAISMPRVMPDVNA